MSETCRALDYFLNGPPVWVAERRWTGTSLLEGAMWWNVYMRRWEKEIAQAKPRPEGEKP